MNLYPWLVFAHVLAVFGLLLAHGGAVAIAFKLRGEREVARIRALLDLSMSTTFLLHISWYALLVAGVVAGFMGNWWGQYWIWTALGLLLLITMVMGPLATRPFMRLRELTHASKPSRMRRMSASAPEASVDAVDPRQLAAALAAIHPWLLTFIGGSGLALILWLMMFKPF